MMRTQMTSAATERTPGVDPRPIVSGGWLKMTVMKMTDQMTGHDIAGHEEAATVFNNHKPFVWFVVRITSPVVINSV